jgi:energy-coupling factor transport system permease protein
MNYFTYLHPATRAVYFLSLFLSIMIVFNPITMGITLASLILLMAGADQNQTKGYLSFFGGLSVSIVVINVLFNHRGRYIFGYIFDRPLTLEALLYGVTSALMIICIILLFQAVSSSITTREFLFLFGNKMPEAGLLISMTCGFFQMLTTRGQDIQQALKMKDIEIAKGTLRERSAAGIQILHVLIALTLENALITVMSMKTKAFGMETRSSGFTGIIRQRDIAFMTLSLLLTLVVVGSWAMGLTGLSVYPEISIRFSLFQDGLFYIAFCGLVLMPFYKTNAYRKKLMSQQEASS